MRAPSPTYFCTSSLPMTRMKHASVRLATARASSVFPVPAPAQARAAELFRQRSKARPYSSSPTRQMSMANTPGCYFQPKILPVPVRAAVPRLLPR